METDFELRKGELQAAIRRTKVALAVIEGNLGEAPPNGHAMPEILPPIVSVPSAESWPTLDPAALFRGSRRGGPNPGPTYRS
jgi:hypothetical protein